MGMLDYETACNIDDIRTRHAIERMRERFLAHFDETAELYDSDDVQKNVVNSDIFLHRYLIRENGNEDSSFDKLKACMKWRKENVIKLREDSFPKEFYSIGGLFIYKEDIDGVTLLFMRVSKVKKSPELEEQMKTFLAYHIEKIENQVGKLQGWAIVFDCAGMGFANVQLGMLNYLVNTVREYYPCGLKYIIVYEIPWLLSGVQKMVYTMLPEEAKKLLQFMNKKNIHKIIPVENLPDYMDGTCQIDYRKAPSSCITFREMYSGRYSDKELERAEDFFRSNGAVISNDEDDNNNNITVN